MWKILPLFVLLQAAHSTCPPNLEPVKNGECRGFYARDQISMDKATAKAIEMCAMIDGKPIRIHGEDDQQYWHSQVPSSNDGRMILGLVCNNNTKQWEWSDGSALDFKPSPMYYSADLDNKCSLGVSWYFDTNGTWMASSMQTSERVQYFCTTQLQQPTPEDAGCDDDDGVCYPVIATVQSWKDAQTLCKKYNGGTLASIHNKQENSFARRSAIAKGAANGVFLGASIQQDGKFAWSDGTKMDYENWAPGFPKNNFGDCIAMDTTSTAGLWMNADCNAKLPAACVVQQETEQTCTGEQYEEGAIITSPGYPFSASTPCDYFLSVAPGKTIEVEVIYLEANSCCDTMIMYDSFLGGRPVVNATGIVANKTYSSGTNQMRVSWKPNGGVNVKGMAISFRAWNGIP